MLKKSIKKALRGIPPFKQFLGRMNNLRSDLENEIARRDNEISNLRMQVNSLSKRTEYLYFSSLHPDLYKVALSDWYLSVTGNVLDLDNPKTFNEKIQWLKLYDTTQHKTELADKYLVRNWVAKEIGEEYLIPLLGVYDKFDDIDFERLPNSFAMKTNHSSGWNIIVQDKTNFDLRKAKERFDNWMKTNFAFVYGLELQYMNIPRKIIIEEYMADLDGEIFDYRFFCFNGKPIYVWVDIGSGTSHHKRNIYNMKWEFQDYRVNYPNIFPLPDRPATFEVMKRLAAQLSREFAFVRVDFYSVKGKIYFGEMTFTPQSGTGKWENEKQNIIYGKMIDLPEKKSIPKRLY